MEEIIEYLKKCQGKNTLMVTHEDADADALGAAYALSIALEGRIGVPGDVAEHGRELIKKLKMNVYFSPVIEEGERIIIVDTADEQQLPDIPLESYAVIDHHRDNKLLQGAEAYLHEETDSTCQLVYRILKKMGLPINREMALALSAGILGDTIYLERASGSTIIVLGEILLQGGITYKDVLEIVSMSRLLTRETKLQAAISAQLYKLGDYLIVFTQTNRDYVYYVAIMLLELGADIALVSYQEGDEVNIRLVKDPRVQDTGLDLFKVMKEGVVGSKIENLWGDENFVGFKGVGKDLEIVKEILENIRYRTDKNNYY